MRLGNGLWESVKFNNQFQTTEITLGTSAGSDNRLKLSYDYGTTDNNGNVKGQTIRVPTIGTVSGFTATQVCTYDGLNRLKSAVETPQPDTITTDFDAGVWLFSATLEIGTSTLASGKYVAAVRRGSE